MCRLSCPLLILCSLLKLQPSLGSHRDALPRLRCAHAHAWDPCNDNKFLRANKVTSAALSPSCCYPTLYFFLSSVVIIILMIFFMSFDFGPYPVCFPSLRFMSLKFSRCPVGRHDALPLLGLLGKKKRKLSGCAKASFRSIYTARSRDRAGPSRAPRLIFKNGGGG